MSDGGAQPAESVEFRETAVPVEPWGFLSPQLQYDVSMVGAVIGGLFALRVIVGQFKRGRILGGRAAVLGSGAFEAARAELRRRRGGVSTPAATSTTTTTTTTTGAQGEMDAAG